MQPPYESIQLDNSQYVQFFPAHLDLSGQSIPYASLWGYGLLLTVQNSMAGLSTGLHVTITLGHDAKKSPDSAVAVVGTSVGLPGEEQAAAVRDLYARLLRAFEIWVKPPVLARSLATISSSGSVPITSTFEATSQGLVKEGFFRKKTLYPWASLADPAVANGEVEVRDASGGFVTGSMKLSAVNVPILGDLMQALRPR